MSNPQYRFTLSHTRDTRSRVQALDQFINTESGFTWTTGANPSVNVVNFTASKYLTGQLSNAFAGTYSVTVDFDAALHSGSATFRLHILLLDSGFNIIDDQDELLSAPGHYSTTKSLNASSPPSYVAVYLINNQILPSNKTYDINSITVTSGSVASSSKVISEPGGWKDAVLTLERHPDFHSLIQHFEGSFIFYGNDGVVDGGIDFIKNIENTYGFNANIEILVEISLGEVNAYQQLFSGLLNLKLLKELPDNKLQCQIKRNDFWTKFISRLKIPVDLQSTTDLDGNAIDPVPTVTIHLPSQQMPAYYSAVATTHGFTDEPTTVIVDGTYYQLNFDEETLDEVEEVFHLLQTTNTQQPVAWLQAKYGGGYEFVIQVVAYDYDPPFNFGVGEDVSDYIRFYINIDGTETEFEIGDEFTSANINGGRVYNLNLTAQLSAGSIVSVYGRAIADLTTGSPYLGQIRWSGPVVNPDTINNVSVPDTTIQTFARIRANTNFPSSEVEAYYLHDAFAGVLERIVGRNAFYSEILGRIDTNMRQYDANGCYSRLAIFKGLQLRGYSLTDRPAAFSFEHLWNGANPILNLGLGYEDIDGVEVIRIEEKAHWYDTSSTSIDIPNVRNIVREYDADYIFNKIQIGYRKWEGENLSGLDDPQTKQTRSTIISDGGEIIIESDFIAASLTIEGTRRKTIEQNKDYKYDNDTFILLFNDNDLSPDRYQPETTENFDSVSGLQSAITRYNIILTPMRNFLRWANYFNGCLQKDLTSSFKFNSGEGNVNVATEYSCSSGEQCLGVICDPISEDSDISLSYNDTFGTLHVPDMANIGIDVSGEEYTQITNNRKKSIGISQVSSNFIKFLARKISFKPAFATTEMELWSSVPFQLIVPDSIQPATLCGTSEVGGGTGEIIPGPCDADFSGYDSDYAAILEYACSQGFTIPSTDQQVLQNQLVLSIKSADIWNRLDLLYIFATDGDSNFAKINWKDPGNFNCINGANAPSFITNVGFQGNGTNQNLSTQWDPATNAVHLTQNDAGAFCYINNETTDGTKSAFGCHGPTGVTQGSIALQPKNTGNHVYTIVQTTACAGIPTGSSVGFYHLERSASNVGRLYKNGSQVGSDCSNASSTLSSRDIAICAFNGGVITSFSDAEIGFFAIGESMSGIDHSLFYNAWTNYFLSL